MSDFYGIDLYDHQKKTINDIYTLMRAGKKKIVLCGPTGSGKTEIAMGIILHAMECGRRVNFMADRKALISQTSERFARAGIDHGMKQGNNTFGQDKPVQIMTPQTIIRRGIVSHTRWIAPLNIVDECHILYDGIAKEIEKSESAWIGMSATPFREGLKGIYTGGVVNVSTTSNLIESGYLAPLKVFLGEKIVPKKRNFSGEYDAESATDETMKIVGNIVKEWKEKTNEFFGGPVKTICFCNTVRDGADIAANFCAEGFPFELVSYLDTDDERREKISSHRNGTVLGLVSCEALQRGYDVRDILCVIDAHPWRKSLSSVLQQFGRGMRSFPGKDFCLLLDHAQNYLRFRNRIEDFFDEGCLEMLPRDKEAGPDRPDREDAVCPDCDALMHGRECHECGYEAPEKRISQGPSGTICIDGRLVELDPEDRRKHVVKIGRSEYEIPPPSEGWGMLCRMAKDRGRSQKKGQRWVQANHMNLYGRFAPKKFNPDLEYKEADIRITRAIEHSTQLYISKIKRTAVA